MGGHAADDGSRAGGGVRPYLVRAKEMSRELGEQIQALAERMAILHASLGPIEQGCAPTDALHACVMRQDAELVLAREELLAQHEALQESHAWLEEQREKYLDLFDNAPDAYITTDSRGFIREANVAAAVMLGMTGERMRGRPLVSFAARRDTRTLRDQIHALSGGQERSTFNVRLRPRGGDPFEVSLSARRVCMRRDGSTELRWTARIAADAKGRGSAEDEPERPDPCGVVLGGG